MPGYFRILLTSALSIYLLLQAGNTFSQGYFTEPKYNTDSLKAILQTATGAERVKTLCTLAWQYRIDLADRSIPLAREAYDLANGINDPALKMQATYTLGLAYHHAGDYANAVGYGLDVKKMAREQHDSAMYYQAMTCVIFSYLYSENRDLALQNTDTVVQFFRNWSTPGELFEKNIRVGWMHMLTGHHGEAISYYLKALDIAEASGQILPQKTALLYYQILNCYLQTQQYDSVRIYLQLGERYCADHGFNFAAYTLDARTWYYLALEKYDSALLCSEQGLEQSRSANFILEELIYRYNLGYIHKQLGNFQKAIENYNEMISLAEWIRDYRLYSPDKALTYSSWYVSEQSVPHYMERTGLKNLMLGHHDLFEIYKSRGDYRSALSELEAYLEASGRISELEKKMDVMEISTRYETERKEQQILLLSSENALNAIKLEQTRYFLFALFGFILLAILVAILLIRQNRMKTMQDRMILQQRLFRAQMNPHFLFNTLSNIQGYMLEHDMDKASQYLSRFSRLMRNILDNTSEDMIPLEQEISTIENYLELQKVRYPGKFDYSIEVDPGIDPEAVMVPPMLAQPFIENAIEHGIKYRKERGKIDIRYSILEIQHPPVPLSPFPPIPFSPGPLVYLTITDDGVGREESRKIEHDLLKKHRPMATSITRERLAVLGRKAGRRLRRRVRLDVEDLYDEHGKAAGTRVTLAVPVTPSTP